MNSLQSLKYSRGKLQVIDQLKLPLELTYIEVNTAEDAWRVIRHMQVRGAPLIACVAVLALAVDVENQRDLFTDIESVSHFLISKMDFLNTSRTTAVNLSTATGELSQLVRNISKAPDADVNSVIDGYIHAAEKMLQDDIATNEAIGDHGAQRILEIVGLRKLNVLTICNTGSLATAGYGTALGVVRSLHSQGLLEQVYACETRPYNQGARLTAFEIVNDGLPGTLITDSMASYLMASKTIDCVIVGADRVAANGDTANKIGTYQLAIVAKYHDIPFFTAVPTTTLDLSLSSGAKIHVEERPAIEMTSIFGQKIAPDGINVWNPSFDITPCSLIRGVITEVGVAEATAGSGGIIDITFFLRSKKLNHLCEKAVPPVEMPVGYVPLDVQSVTTYVLGYYHLNAMLGGSITDVTEVGDGNLNFVYIITGSNNYKVVLKQALPYVRCVGESWPLSLERATFERAALLEERRYAPEYVPEVYHFDKARSVIVMRYVQPPHLILRKQLIAGVRISSFASDVANFCARTLFYTSALAMEGGEFRSRVSSWSRNTAMCALTEKVIFTDPYMLASYNRWTTPQLDSYAEGIRKDSDLKLCATRLKEIFLTNPQALLHGDLHSGSVMVDEGSTFVIDPEFAFYGPIGFDLGAFVSNLFLNYFSQSARLSSGGADYAEWVLSQIITFYETFQDRFSSLWEESWREGMISELYPKSICSSDSQFQQARDRYMSAIYADMLGFTGMKMIRRIVGIAHVADLDSISDSEIRSVCEKRCLNFARKMVFASLFETKRHEFLSIRKVVQYARILFTEKPSPQYQY